MRKILPAALLLALLTGCTPPATTGPVGPDGDPTPTVTFTVHIEGRARVAWTDSDDMTTFTEEAGDHTYTSAAVSAKLVSVITVVPLGDSSSANCEARLTGVGVSQAAPNTDTAAGPGKLAACWATTVDSDAETEPADDPEPVPLRYDAYSETGQFDYAYASSDGGWQYETGAMKELFIEEDGTVPAVIVAVSTSANREVGCSVEGGGDQDSAEARGLGAIALCRLPS